MGEPVSATPVISAPVTETIVESALIKVTARATSDRLESLYSAHALSVMMSPNAMAGSTGSIVRPVR